MLISVTTFTLVLACALQAEGGPTSCTTDDFESAKQLSDNFDFNTKAVLAESKFEGDIEMDETQLLMITSGVGEEVKMWPDARIPYRFASDDFSPAERVAFASAISEVCQKTCLQWVEHTSGPAYVSVKKDDGNHCFTNGVGYNGGKLEMTLSTSECFNRGHILHLMMHVAGLYHEQARMDRDSHVKVEWDNVKEIDQFKKHVDAKDHGEYDFDSITHFPSNAFSKNGQSTIRRKGNPAKLGGRKNLSQGDVAKLKKMYNCEATGCTLPPKGSEEVTGPGSGEVTGPSCVDAAGVNCAMLVGNGFCSVSTGPGKFAQRKCCKSCKNAP